MKNKVYNPLQKLVLVVMVLFASNAIAQTTTGQTTEKKSYSGSVVSPKASEAKMQKPATNPAKTTKSTGPVTKTTPGKAHPKGTQSNVKTRSGQAGAAKAPDAAKPAVAKTSTAVKNNAVYTSPAPVSRKAQLISYIADIDAEMPKVKGTAAETKLVDARAGYQAELDAILAKEANEKKN